MIIDDSAVVRGLFTRWVAAAPDIELTGSAPDGAQGVAKIAALDPDVVVLDIEMPVMGGLEALPKLLAAKPGVRVVMASTLSHKGAEVTLRALSLGAADYIGKPESARIGGADSYRDELLQKIRALAPRSAGRTTSSFPATATGAPPAPSTGSVLRPLPPARRRPEILAVGASTGGPQALREFFGALNGAWTPPIVVVQHMPPAFTTILAEHLGKVSSLSSVEAAHGMPLLPGRIHLAPGDKHMTVHRAGAGWSLQLDQGPPENFCRPAVDPLFRSVASLFADRALAVVLTGMGADGREGARAVVNAGGVVLAQDEASSVVWGMPGAVAQAGLASMLRPAPALAQAVRALGRGERP
ncbi:MAG: chemotaxis response regulator protein-glutamate methylesterase [Proteobacteria bacterium]|nr:chemotaxis response regulator protein-glutamate methylesterase [Pseudomonadota bacterium]